MQGRSNNLQRHNGNARQDKPSIPNIVCETEIDSKLLEEGSGTIYFVHLSNVMLPAFYENIILEFMKMPSTAQGSITLCHYCRGVLQQWEMYFQSMLIPISQYDQDSTSTLEAIESAIARAKSFQDKEAIVRSLLSFLLFTPCVVLILIFWGTLQEEASWNLKLSLHFQISKTALRWRPLKMRCWVILLTIPMSCIIFILPGHGEFSLSQDTLAKSILSCLEQGV